MASEDHERTASLMSPAKLAQMKPKAAASPAAWLDQMAADVGHMHVRQLSELTERLRAQAAGRDAGVPAQEVRALADALPKLDVSLLQPRGLLARMTGKARSAGAEFAAQYEHIVEAAQALRQAAQAQAKAQQGGAAAGERTLVEFEVEWRAVEKIIDQGARWLQDMRNQLKARQAQAADAAAQQQVREDAARCEVLVTRLKGLRAVATAAQQVHQQVQGIAARRASLAQVLQQSLPADLKNWQARWQPIAAAAGDSGTPALSLEGPGEAQRELQQRLAHLEADRAQLAQQEQALAESLAALDQQLQAAA